MALSPAFSLFFLWWLVSTATAFDITKILNQYSDYEAFNQELSRTEVAEEINTRKSVTIFVVSNDAMSTITSQNQSAIADIMRIHVVLDYYDSAKIKALKDETTLTTLYQTTGSANKEQGFITLTKDNNEIKLGSAVFGSQMSAKVNKIVTSVPYDISVIEISSPIIPTGIDESVPPPSESLRTQSPHHSPSNSPSNSPVGSSSDGTPVSAPAPSCSDADTPSHDTDADADHIDVDVDDIDTNEPSVSSSSRNDMVSGIIILASFVATL